MAIDPVIDKRPRSLVHMFLDRVDESPDADAYYYPVEAGWQESSWRQTRVLVEGLAAGLLALGIETEDRVAIIASTRYEWVIAKIAGLWSGAAVTAVDPSADDDTVAAVLRDSGARVVIAEDYQTVRTLWRVRNRIRDVVKVVQIDGDYPDQRVLTLEGLLALGHEHLEAHPRVLSQRMYALRREGLATIHYVPDPVPGRGLRGVRLTHQAITYQAAAIASLGLLTDGDLLHLALPLTGVFGQALLGVQLACGFPVGLEGRPDHAIPSLELVRPTIAAVTARMLDDVRDRTEHGARSGVLRRHTTDRAFEVARQVREYRHQGRVPGRLARRHRSLDRRVMSPVREVFGDRLRFLVAPGIDLDPGLVEFFDLAGVTLLEAYGRAETGGAVCVARPEDAGSGTAGRPLPGSDVRISDVGEILVRGPGVMEGYHHRSVATRSAFDQGWLRTGDAGVLDDAGRLRVLGGHVTHDVE
ncbi:MAG: AMP-binding protein [Nocardioides sp.]|nr:AMP-binding protein [Nocardioides sp.]